MAENSTIEWTTHTFNPWVGCAKVSPACDFCYAENWAKRTGQATLWDGDRRRTRYEQWRKVGKWDTLALVHGERPWVFCASLADVFDNAVPDEWRADLWRLIKSTPHLRWQLLSKRIGNAERMLPPDWGPDYDHVGFMATIANQEEADRDLGKLTDLKRRHRVSWIGISYEPALGPLLLQHRELIGGVVRNWLGDGGLDWVVAGGESGPRARPPHQDWFRSVRDQCTAAGTPFLFKQWGEWLPGTQFNEANVVDPDPEQSRFACVHWDGDRWVKNGGSWIDDTNGDEVYRVGKKAAGRLLDGREHNGMPTVFGEAMPA